MKTRPGGVLSKRGAALTVHEQRAVDGDPRALRAIIRQALGVNTIDLRLAADQVRMGPNGTGGDRLTFTGTFTALDHPFTMWDWYGDYTEIMRPGSLDRTLGMSPDVQFVLNHDWMAAPMARTVAGSLELSTDGTQVARIDGSRSDVAIVASAVEGGELNAMSFAFWVTQQTWSPDYMQRDIFEVDMDGGDTSVVTHPANPGTTGTVGLRKRQAASLLRSKVPGLLVARARSERRADDTLSDATREALQQVLDLVAEADVAVDAAQPLLAELLGVPNPDADADEETDSADAGDSESQSADVDEAELVRAAQLARLRRELAA